MTVGWDREKALKAGKARTRDGRTVIDLHEGVLDGEQVLVGKVLLKEPPPQKVTCILFYEVHCWDIGGLGLHGGHDLMDYN